MDFQPKSGEIPEMFVAESRAAREIGAGAASS
jgi:hypothetical protein